MASASSLGMSSRTGGIADGSVGNGASAARRAGAADELDVAKQVDEKRRRRRESHNAVERRRRDNINEKIHELSSLLPEVSTDIQNKGAILRRSVEYIKMMQALASRQQERMTELESVCHLLLQRCGMQESDLLLSVPLGTVFELPQISGVTASDSFQDDLMDE